MAKGDESVLRMPDSLLRHQTILSELEEERVFSVEPIKSTWKDGNRIYKITTERGTYVFKEIGEGGDNELQRAILMRQTYGHIFPRIISHENNAYLMEFREGSDFFELNENERGERVVELSRVLREKWSDGEYEKVDITQGIKKGFDRYRRTRARFFRDNELKEVDLSMFSEVPNRPSHNDLNCANVLFGEGITLIDPSDEGYNDVARDVGRYLASMFFNNYDRFGGDKERSLELADSFLSGFNGDFEERVRHYIGESFIAFIKFQTVSVDKRVLKDLAINLFTSKKPILHCLEDCL